MLRAHADALTRFVNMLLSFFDLAKSVFSSKTAVQTWLGSWGFSFLMLIDRA